MCPSTEGVNNRQSLPKIHMCFKITQVFQGILARLSSNTKFSIEFPGISIYNQLFPGVQVSPGRE